MPTVASYVETAKAALLAGEAEQAASVCRHVLTYYPKHVEANCLLAEALRDLSQIGPAKDIFLRVVSADPTNLVAHWALSLIAEAENDREWATWELWRAWEANPSHPELRHELQRLTGAKPSLTPLALAQTYVAGGLFDDAIAELRRLLAVEPTRLDAAVTLAEALWRAGRLEKAAQTCEDILRDSPDCLKANCLLGTWLYAGPSETRDKGRRLLLRALELDPSASVAAELLAGETLPDVLSVPTAEIPPMPEQAVAELSEESPNVLERATQGAPAETLVAAGSEAVARGAEGSGRPQEERQPEAVGAGQRGRARGRSDLADWLRDSNEQAASVQEALGSRLASLAAQRSAADLAALADVDPEWQELLTEEITLDEEAERRLSRALSEMTLGPAGEPAEGWVEVPTASAGARPHPRDAAQPDPPPAASATPDDRLRTASHSASTPATEPAVLPAAAKTSGKGAPAATPARAAALWRNGDPEAALEEYREVLRSDPQAADHVVEELKKLIQAYPELAAAHRVLGDAYMRAGRFQQAIDEYNWVLARKQSEA